MSVKRKKARHLTAAQTSEVSHRIFTSTLDEHRGHTYSPPRPEKKASFSSTRFCGNPMCTKLACRKEEISR
jgi:hypothetical protein